MSRFFRSAIMACAMTLALAGAASAASAVKFTTGGASGTNSAFWVANELFGASGVGLTLGSVGVDTISYTLAANATLNTNDSVVFTFNGETLTDATGASNYDLCVADGTSAGQALTITSSSLVFKITTTTALTNAYSGALKLVTGTCAGLGANLKGYLTFNIPTSPGSSGSNVVVSSTTLAGGVATVNSNAAATGVLYIGSGQFTGIGQGAIPVTTGTIDFASGLTTVNGLTTTPGNVLANFYDNLSAAPAGSGGGSASNIVYTLTGTNKAALTLSGNLNGMSSIYLGTTATPFTINTVTNASATLSAQGMGGGTGTFYNKTISFVSFGTGSTKSLAQGTITLTGATTTGPPAGNFTFINTLNYLTLNLNSTQYYVPFVKNVAGSASYIKLQSKNTNAGTNGIKVNILASNGTTTGFVTITPAAGTTGVNQTAITAGTPSTITGADLAATATAAGVSVSTTDAFAVIIQVNAPITDVFAYAQYLNGATNQYQAVPIQAVFSTAASSTSPYIVQ